MKLKCIAVDDEPLALNLICSYIEQTPFMELVSKYDNGIDALKSMYDQEIHLAFLDIQMGGLTGVELARVTTGRAPKIGIIFTTAYDQFAIEGYKVDAIDYLLKPFNYEEFLRAAQKAKDKFELIENSKTGKKPEEQYLFLKVEHQLVRVNYKEISFLEGYKDYVKVHLDNGKMIMSLTSLKNMEEILPEERFMRIHRSFMVSLSKIDLLTKNSVQIGETFIPVTEKYREKFDQFVSQWKN